MKDKSKWIKVLKIVGIVGTAISALVGAGVSVSSLYDVYRAKSGYTEHTSKIKQNHTDIDKNREEIRFLYRALILGRAEEPTPPTDVEDKLKDLPKIPEQKAKEWEDLPIQQRAMP